LVIGLRSIRIVVPRVALAFRSIVYSDEFVSGNAEYIFRLNARLGSLGLPRCKPGHLTRRFGGGFRVR
jgi:hypothetical protein